MITDEGEVKILDFGLAKYKGQPRLIQDGSKLGTIAYMSPEQSKYLHYRHHTKYDFLREDPRFQEILAKHKELYDENMRKYGYVEEQK